jgi:hypothetical protein
MTITGLILIPLCLVMIFCPWRYTVLTLVLCSLLSSAAVMNVGNIGLQPVFFFMPLVIARTAVEIALGKQELNGYALRMMAPLGILLVVSTVVLLISVLFFQGNVIVVSGAAAFNLDLAGPFSVGRENLAQTIYLGLDIATVYCLAHQGGRSHTVRFSRIADRSLVIAGFASGLVAFWELINFYTGVGFPAEFFHSNAGYAAAYGRTFGDIPRISGPFAEPSSMGYVFGGLILFAWQRYRASPTLLSSGLLLVCVAALILSASTTGYVALTIFLLVVLQHLVFGSAEFITSMIKGGRRELTLTLTFLLVIAAIAFFVVLRWDTLREVFQIVVFEKRESSSFDERSGADLIALNIFIQTGGIGVGLGSHRPNNMVMTLLSNLGIAGFLSFVFFVFQLFRQHDPLGGRSADVAKVRMRLKGFVFGLLLIHTFSSPALSGGLLWISFALVLGVAVEGRSAYAFRSAPHSRSFAYVSGNPFRGLTHRRPLSVDGSDHRTGGRSWRYPNSSSIRAAGP